MWRHLLNELLHILVLCQYTAHLTIHRASPVYSRWTYIFGQG